MARVTFNSGKAARDKLEKLGREMPKIGKDAVQAAADIFADEIRKNLEKNLKNSKHSTGDLESSFGIAPVDIDEKGTINTVVGFHGYDRKGAPNLLKARAMESGTSTQPAKPFFRLAVNSKRREARQAMNDTIKTGSRKITKE